VLGRCFRLLSEGGDRVEEWRSGRSLEGLVVAWALTPKRSVFLFLASFAAFRFRVVSRNKACS